MSYETLTKKLEFISSMIEITEHQESHTSFKVYIVDSWDRHEFPQFEELYFSGSIKWDGCANLDFYENYYHFCNFSSIELHCEIMQAMYKYVIQYRRVAATYFTE